MVLKSEAIKQFLLDKTHRDLADLYSIEMECQVNAAADGGQPTGGQYNGKRWRGWTDGKSVWKTFRIPYKADTDPEYTDKPLKWNLSEHTEGIGLTGWNWQQRKSYWVGYDFDAIVGHSKMHTAKLTQAELDEVAEEAKRIPWVTVRRSTSGRGLHLYVMLGGVSTSNHSEHAALARAILAKMSALTGFSFESKIDVCGGNMWVWHRKMLGTEGLALIKQGETLKEIPLNWKDHLNVIKGKRTRTVPANMQDVDLMESLASQRPYIALEAEHKTLIKYLDSKKATWWWDPDHHMLVAHTKDLEEAHTELQLKGYFKTASEGTNRGEQNCFAFPTRGGGWIVRRYSKGVIEDKSWDQDSGGWRRAYLNCEPDLPTACRAFEGVEDERGAFQFRTATAAAAAAGLLGVNVIVPKFAESRKAQLVQHKDGRLVFKMLWEPHDTAEHMSHWHVNTKRKEWVRIFNANIAPSIDKEVDDFDDFIRHMVDSQDSDSGWAVHSQGAWRNEPLTHVKPLLASMGYNGKEMTALIGTSIRKAWKIVNKPFQPEYPGNREWNRYAAQFRFAPSTEDGEAFPIWRAIFEHCGSGLDRAVEKDEWCRANGIISGADYLQLWVTSLLQKPEEPLPYLFFYGPQNSGKSIFHEAISLLLTRGYSRADSALVNNSGFNAEIEHSVLCVIEETDLNANKNAYNKIKDWVNSRMIQIHQKGKTPYLIPNTTHWCHCANDHEACPIFPGDTRITMCYVGKLDKVIPKREIITLLEKEAPAFLAAVLKSELPISRDRLNVPVIATDDKRIVEALNQTVLQRFLATGIVESPGRKIKFSDFYSRFITTLSQEDRQYYSKIRVGKQMPPHIAKGRDRGSNQVYICNVWWADEEQPAAECKRFYVSDDYIFVEE